MKFIARSVRGLAALVMLSGAAVAGAVEVGKGAPDFELPGTAGPIKLSQFKGKTVYLDFWASWCGPCKQSFPWMNEIQSRWKQQGLQVVGINVDQKTDDAQAFLKTTPADFTVAFDAQGKMPREYAIKGMPTSLLIAPDGRVLYVHTGFHASDKSDLEKQIRQALNVKDEK